MKETIKKKVQKKSISLDMTPMRLALELQHGSMKLFLISTTLVPLTTTSTVAWLKIQIPESSSIA